MSGVGKQISQTQRVAKVLWLPPFPEGSSDTITLTRQGNVVNVQGAYNTHSSGEIGDIPFVVNEKIPNGYRPRDYAYIISGTGRWIIGYDPTNQSLNVRGNNNGRRQIVTGVWFTDDPFPA